MHGLAILTESFSLFRDLSYTTSLVAQGFQISKSTSIAYTRVMSLQGFSATLAHIGGCRCTGW